MIYNHEVVRSLSSSITTLFLHDVSCLADVAFSLAYLVRLAPRLAGFVQQFPYPSCLLAVVALVAADLGFGLDLGSADLAVVAVPVVAVVGLGSADFVAVVAVVAATSA